MLSSVLDFIREMRAEKARTTVTILGIGWGTFSVVLLLAFGMGLEHHLRKKSANFGAAIGIVWAQRTTKPFAGLGSGRAIRLQADDILRLPSQIPEIELVSPEYVRRESIAAGDRVHRVTLSGVYPAYEHLRAWQVRAGGRFLNDRDVEESRRVMVLGNRIASGLFGRQQPVGREVILRGSPFRVIGVLVPKLQDSNYAGEDQDRICLPATTVERLFGTETISNFVYRARNLAVHRRATDSLYRELGRLYQFDETDRQALNIWDTTEEQQLLFFVFLGFNLILGSSGVLTLLVGAVGVGNLLFIRVRVRRREIGMQMAMGARRRTILANVLGESLVLVGSGGALGLGAAWAVTAAALETSVTEHVGVPAISPALAATTVLVLVVVGLAAGYFPARRAAGLDPVRALED